MKMMKELLALIYEDIVNECVMNDSPKWRPGKDIINVRKYLLGVNTATRERWGAEALIRNNDTESGEFIRIEIVIPLFPWKVSISEKAPYGDWKPLGVQSPGWGNTLLHMSRGELGRLPVRLQGTGAGALINAGRCSPHLLLCSWEEVRRRAVLGQPLCRRGCAAHTHVSDPGAWGTILKGLRVWRTVC